MLRLSPRFGRGFASSAFGLFWSAPAARSKTQSTFLLRRPPATAVREAPTPLVFLSAEKWDADSRKGMKMYAHLFSERGYTTMEVDLGPPLQPLNSSEALMLHYENELSSHIRLAGIPFPPLIIARSAAGGLIAQTYISSNPASGLVLLSPPTSVSAPEAQSLLPDKLAEYDYEPHFPLLILDTPANKSKQEKENRLIKAGVDFAIVDDLEGQEAWTKLERWMDEQGI